MVLFSFIFPVNPYFIFKILKRNNLLRESFQFGLTWGWKLLGMVHSAKSLEILIAYFNWRWKWISNFLWEWNWVFADGSVKHLLRCSPPSLPGVQQPGGTNVAPWLGLWGVKGYSKAAWGCLSLPTLVFISPFSPGSISKTKLQPRISIPSLLPSSQSSR